MVQVCIVSSSAFAVKVSTQASHLQHDKNKQDTGRVWRWAGKWVWWWAGKWVWPVGSSLKVTVVVLYVVPPPCCSTTNYIPGVSESWPLNRDLQTWTFKPWPLHLYTQSIAMAIYIFLWSFLYVVFIVTWNAINLCFVLVTLGNFFLSWISSFKFASLNNKMNGLLTAQPKTGWVL